jgi:hypothetical protein
MIDNINTVHKSSLSTNHCGNFVRHVPTTDTTPCPIDFDLYKTFRTRLASYDS